MGRTTYWRTLGKGNESISIGSLLPEIGQYGRARVTVEVLSTGILGINPYGWAADKKSLSPGRGTKGLVVHQMLLDRVRRPKGYVALCNPKTKLGYGSNSHGAKECKECVSISKQPPVEGQLVH